MIRTCPKCGDYYADGSLAFCLVDGTPLVVVDPQSESWTKGRRVIEEKETALGKQRRKRKWRRVLTSAMTMLMIVMVVCVVVVNSLIYLKPEEEETAQAKPSTPATVPTRVNSSLAPRPPGKPSPTPKPSPTATPKIAATPITVKIDTPPPPPPPDTTFVETTVCSEADRSREREIIIRRFGALWRLRIEGERRRIIAENMPARPASNADGSRERKAISNLSGANWPQNVEGGPRQTTTENASPRGPIRGFPGQTTTENMPPRAASAEASLEGIEFTSTFSKTCTSGLVTARYVWQVRTNVNGTVKVVRVAKEKRFTCGKIGGVWLCS